MEKIKNSMFSDFEIIEGLDYSIRNNTLSVKKWSWDYTDFLEFQKKAQAYISTHKKQRIYIFCNHPHCFTVGRGNERGAKDLIDFDKNLVQDLIYPVHEIHRGGGITFHYPGQWIFYPIVAINNEYTLETHMCWMLKSVKEILKDKYGLDHVMAAKKLMGVWYERKKLASIGVGLRRFVTEHGLALNLIHDEEMFKEVHKTNPCGMNPTTYTTLDKIKSIKERDLIEEFHQYYLESID